MRIAVMIFTESAGQSTRIADTPGRLHVSDANRCGEWRGTGTPDPFERRAKHVLRHFRKTARFNNLQTAHSECTVTFVKCADSLHSAVLYNFITAVFYRNALVPWRLRERFCRMRDSLKRALLRSAPKSTAVNTSPRKTGQRRTKHYSSAHWALLIGTTNGRTATDLFQLPSLHSNAASGNRFRRRLPPTDRVQRIFTSMSLAWAQRALADSTGGIDADGCRSQCSRFKTTVNA